MYEIAEIIADVYFLLAEEGGRQTPMASGYCPSLATDGTQVHCRVEFKGEDAFFAPGRRHRVRIRVGNTHLLDKPLEKGRDFVLKEGYRVVARGVVVEVIAQ